MKKFDTVALLLAGGLALSIVLLTVGVVWTAVRHGNTAATLTENETQVLISAFGGIFGILGAYLGYRAGNGDRNKLPPVDPSIEDTKEWPQK